jgi:hypothetical protein
MVVQTNQHIMLQVESNMSPEQFKTFVENNNMEIVSQNVIQFEPLELWNGTDCISIFRKPL